MGRFRMCLNTSRNHVSRSSVEAFKSVQKNKLKVPIHKARQLHLLSLRKLFKDWCARHILNCFSTPPIYRGLRILEFKSDFHGIREYVFGSSFLLTLDI